MVLKWACVWRQFPPEADQPLVDNSARPDQGFNAWGICAYGYNFGITSQNGLKNEKIGTWQSRCRYQVCRNHTTPSCSGEKIAIDAPNGAGKSTLLNIIAGRIETDEGEVKIGPGLKMGYYTQEHLQALDEHSTLVEELQKSAPFHWYGAISYLKRFLFDEDRAGMEVRFLSGGQKSRLQLAKFLATNPDILILDELTNHLDLKTVLTLENFLKDYEGTLMLVSHDRELVANTVDTVYKLENGALKEVIN